MPSNDNGACPRRPTSVATALRHHRREEFEEARQACLHAWGRGSADARIPYLMACIEVHAENPDEAASRFLHGFRNDPDEAATGRSSQTAIPPALSQTLSQDPRPDRICRKIGISLHDGGEDRAALLALKAWLAYAPGDVRAMEVMGEVAGRIGDHALASAMLQRALRLVPQRADLALKLGNALNRQVEPRQALATCRETYDRVVAADVFIYTGCLDEVLTLIGKCLAVDGRLIFSTEKSRCGSFHLQPSGRFAHDRAYVEGLAREHGFHIETVHKVPVRMEAKRWIDGELFILAIAGEG